MDGKSPHSTGLFLILRLPHYSPTTTGIQYKAGQGYRWLYDASWRLVLSNLNHTETGFRYFQNGFFDFSSWGYWEMGAEHRLIRPSNRPTILYIEPTYRKESPCIYSLLIFITFSSKKVNQRPHYNVKKLSFSLDFYVRLLKWNVPFKGSLVFYP